MIRSVSVRLRSGIGRAVLPGDDNRKMVSGTTYKIAYETFQRIAPGALASVVEVVSVDTTVASREGIDLTTNTVSLPTVTVDGATRSLRLGKVTEGFVQEAFRLVKLVDAVNVALGDVVVWASKTANTVTADKVGGTAATPLEFAGVAVGTGTAGRYIWVQIDGEASVATEADVAVGDSVELHPTTDKTLRGIFTDAVLAVNEIQTLNLTAGAENDTFKLTQSAVESSAVTIPAGGFAHVTAAQIKTALLTITAFVGKTADIAVVKTLNAYAITFSGTLAATDIGAITVTSKTGAADGSVTETLKGVAAVASVSQSGTTPVVGVAVSGRASSKNDIRLAGPYTGLYSRKARHVRHVGDFFARA